MVKRTGRCVSLSLRDGVRAVLRLDMVTHTESPSAKKENNTSTDCAAPVHSARTLTHVSTSHSLTHLTHLTHSRQARRDAKHSTVRTLAPICTQRWLASRSAGQRRLLALSLARSVRTRRTTSSGLSLRTQPTLSSILMSFQEWALLLLSCKPQSWLLSLIVFHVEREAWV